MYECPECLPGWFWDANEDTPNCARCYESIADCVDCSSGERCVKCSDGFFPNYLQDECITNIPDCISNKEDYDSNGEVFICPECNTGHYSTWDGECLSCVATVSDVLCLNCAGPGICSECANGSILLPDKSGCFLLPIAHCEDRPEEYGVIEEEN